jgi:hypothetical protein
MAEIDGLLLLGVKRHGEDYPPDNKGRHQTPKKPEQSAPKGLGDDVGVVGEDEFDERRNPPTLW